MYEVYYDYVKPKYGEKAKLCYIHTDIIWHFHGVHKNRIFKKVLEIMLKIDLVLQIMN